MISRTFGRAGGCVFAVFAASLIGACSALPRADDSARAAGFTKRIVAGAAFRHVTYASADSPGPVWIYIEGDGTPWLGEYVPAADPSPRTLVAMEAMAAGPRPALYVGRPCYFDVNSDPGCNPLVWTHRRFAPEVVSSLAFALRNEIRSLGWAGRPIVLVGFSGGGTLATLLAPEVEGACALITLASPLDIEEWAVSRGYSPLAGSINPATNPPVPDGVRQLHLRGRLDRIVAANNGIRFQQANPRAEFRILEIGHGRDWVAVWRALTHSGGVPVAHCAGSSLR